MHEFPQIQENQYIVIFVDKSTGVLVDQDGEWYVQAPHQLLHTVVDNYDEAELTIKSRLQKQPNLEGSIFNSRYELLIILR